MSLWFSWVCQTSGTYHIPQWFKHPVHSLFPIKPGFKIHIFPHVKLTWKPHLSPRKTVIFPISPMSKGCFLPTNSNGVSRTWRLAQRHDAPIAETSATRSARTGEAMCCYGRSPSFFDVFLTNFMNYTLHISWNTQFFWAIQIISWIGQSWFKGVNQVTFFGKVGCTTLWWDSIEGYQSSHWGRIFVNSFGVVNGLWLVFSIFHVLNQLKPDRSEDNSWLVVWHIF